mmetsp:Transcript_18052/g.46149  ORF Transcript_18052/g.46149 Transcript_18052/m.46149 type:complete len:209 (-) Transcript_18052:87-713(-)
MAIAVPAAGLADQRHACEPCHVLAIVDLRVAFGMAACEHRLSLQQLRDDVRLWIQSRDAKVVTEEGIRETRTMGEKVFDRDVTQSGHQTVAMDPYCVWAGSIELSCMADLHDTRRGKLGKDAGNISLKTKRESSILQQGGGGDRNYGLRHAANTEDAVRGVGPCSMCEGVVVTGNCNHDAWKPCRGHKGIGPRCNGLVSARVKTQIRR